MGLLSCLPEYDALLEEGPTGQAAWLSNSVLASRMQFLMGILAPCIFQLPQVGQHLGCMPFSNRLFPASSEIVPYIFNAFVGLTAGAPGQDVVEEQVCSPALLYLKHTHSPAVSSAHLLFCAALRHVCKASPTFTHPSLPWPCLASSQLIADSHCMSHRTGLKAASEESRHLSLRHQALIGDCDYRTRSWYRCM